MKNKSLKILALILAVGLAAAVVACMLTGMVKAPTITEHDFQYSVTYKLDGETKTLNGVYRCNFADTGKGSAPLYRYYEGTYLTKTSEYHPAAYTIAEKDGLELCIVTIFSDRYLMNDADGETIIYEPYLAVMDREGMEYTEEEYLGKFDAELVSWQLPEPVVNSFVFVGFSHLYDGSMVAMLIVGLLVILACMIVMKRDKTVPYKGLDKVSVVLNVILAVVAIPFLTVVIWLSQVAMSTTAWNFQVMLCVPAITAFSIAASLSLRRKGFTKAGFFIQFVGPVLFGLLVL